MKYKLIIENNLKKTALKRVRIKVDPSLVCQTEDLSQCDGYEGYILAETGDVPKVLVMSPDGVSSVMDIPQQFLQMLMSDEESEALRAFKHYICDICELDTATPEAEILLNAASIEEVEAILKQTGLTDDELKVLYRNFIADSGDMVNEGVFSNLLSQAATASKMGAKAVARTVTSPAALAKGIGSVINTIDPGNKIGGVISNLGNQLDSLYKSVKNQNVKDALKKLERPPDGKDLSINDRVKIQLPLKGNIETAAAVSNVQGSVKDGKAIVTIAPLQRGLPIDKIVVIDTGSVRAEIMYYLNGNQISEPEVKKNKWPVDVGLHKVNTGSWIINTDIKDDKFTEFVNEIIATLKHDEVKDKFDVTDTQISLLSRAKTNKDIQSTLGLRDQEAFQELLGYWAKYNGPGAIK